MITVVKEFTFDAAHFLPDYDGACRNMHGHMYKLQIGVVNADFQPLRKGFVIDFAELKNVVKEHIIDVLDHTLLNEVQAAGFPRDTPTAELMAYWIAAVVGGHLPDEVDLRFVRLWETPTSYAEWS